LHERRFTGDQSCVFLLLGLLQGWIAIQGPIPNCGMPRWGLMRNYGQRNSAHIAGLDDSRSMNPAISGNMYIADSPQVSLWNRPMAKDRRFLILG